MDHYQTFRQSFDISYSNGMTENYLKISNDFKDLTVSSTIEFCIHFNLEVSRITACNTDNQTT